jgi:hypothetical protein
VSIWPASMELRQSNKMPVMRNNEQQSSSFSKIPFVVRDDTGIRDIVFQTSDTTWHAYNGWHGNSLYGGGGPASDGRAYKVSYNRPIATRDGTGTYAGPQDFLFGVETAVIHWLEANGLTSATWPGSTPIDWIRPAKRDNLPIIRSLFLAAMTSTGAGTSERMG